MSYLNVGVDLGVTAKHKACVCNEQGEKLMQNKSFYTTKEALDTLCEKALENAEPETKLRFICEPTEMAWFPLAIYATVNEYEFVRVKSHKTHDLRKYYSRHKKNDKLDSDILAKMPIVDNKAMEVTHLPDAETFALERCNRQYERVSKESSAIKNRLSSLYHWVMPGLLDCFENTFDSRAREFYRHFSNPFHAKETGINGIREMLNPACRQKMKDDLPEKLYAVAASACELYANSSHLVNFAEIQNEVCIELQLLEAHETVILQLKEKIEEFYEKVHPSKNIETIKGIAETLGPSIIGMVGNPNRFSSQSAFRCYSGMIPKQDDSGEVNKKGLSLTQEGPSRLRRDVFLAADVARQWDPQLAKIYYEEMVYKGHCHTEAVCAVIPNLLNRILCILKENRPYELRDINGEPISSKVAKQIIKENFIVPEEIRQRTRSRRSRKSQKNKKEERIRNIIQEAASRSSKFVCHSSK